MFGSAVAVSVQKLQTRLYIPSIFIGYIFIRTHADELLILTAVLAISATILDEFASVMDPNQYNNLINMNSFSSISVPLQISAFFQVSAILSIPFYIQEYQSQAPEAESLMYLIILVFISSIVSNKIATITKEKHGWAQTRLTEFKNTGNKQSKYVRIREIIK